MTATEPQAPERPKPKPINTCNRPKCGAVYSGTSHACKDPE